jgi:hypothetical protein
MPELPVIENVKENEVMVEEEDSIGKKIGNEEQVMMELLMKSLSMALKKQEKGQQQAHSIAFGGLLGASRSIPKMVEFVRKSGKN